MRAASQELGYHKLHENQRVVVTSFLKGKGILVCLPTGSGKSLYYCLLPYMFDALMQSNRFVIKRLPYFRSAEFDGAKYALMT